MKRELITLGLAGPHSRLLTLPPTNLQVAAMQKKVQSKKKGKQRHSFELDPTSLLWYLAQGRCRKKVNWNSDCKLDLK